MGWFTRKAPEPKAPIWREHRLEPKADMTAQELALILATFSPGCSAGFSDGFLFPADEDPTLFFERKMNMPQIGRHFGERVALLDDHFLSL